MSSSREFEKTPVLQQLPRIGKTPALSIPFDPAVTAGDPRKKNRRAWVRWPCDLEAFCRPQAAQAEKLWWMGRIRKVSRGGLRLLLSLRLEPGALVEVEVVTCTGPFPRTLTARVVHAAPLRYGGWTYGCALLEVLSEVELRSLLA
jgi:hypothetical protein